MLNQEHKAVEIRLKKEEKALYVSFEDGRKIRFPAEYLRIESPSAEMTGHSFGQRKIIAGRKHIGIIGLEPVGHYAIRIIFDDLHETGIYSWNYLYEIGNEKWTRMRKYLKELKKIGKSRDPKLNVKTKT